jgi:hypothetical protein
MNLGATGLLLIIVLVGGGIGAAIGYAKGRPLLGFFLGLLLSWIGWIIVAVLPRREARTRP